MGTAAAGAARIDRSTVAVAIPCYCEGKRIAEVVRRVLAQVDRVAVVDDGSPDDTAEAARAAGAFVIVHEQNRGKGEAIKTGLRHWHGEGAEYVIILDGDGQHLPEEIERFIAAAASSRSGLLVGTRMEDLARMPLVRRLVNRYMSSRISRVCGQEIPDTQCGFRMLHRDLVPGLLGLSGRFEYETEMLILASRQGLRIEAVPITTVYGDEKSKIRPVRDTIRFLKLMSRYEK